MPSMMPTDEEWQSAGYHIEEYRGDAANVIGRVRLPSERTAALQREINRAQPTAPHRPARSPLMQERLAKAQRDVRRLIGNVA